MFFFYHNLHFNNSAIKEESSHCFDESIALLHNMFAASVHGRRGIPDVRGPAPEVVCTSFSRLATQTLVCYLLLTVICFVLELSACWQIRCFPRDSRPVWSDLIFVCFRLASPNACGSLAILLILLFMMPWILEC